MEDDKTPTDDSKPDDQKPDDHKTADVIAVVETDPQLKSKYDEAVAELERLKTEAQQRADAELSEKDREKKRADEAEARIADRDETVRRLSILQSVRDAASDQKMDIDFEAVKDLYEAGCFKAVKVDDKGDAIGVPDFLKSLVKDKPYILRKAEVKAPDINADKSGNQKTGEMTDDRKAALQKRFKLRK